MIKRKHWMLIALLLISSFCSRVIALEQNTADIQMTTSTYPASLNFNPGGRGCSYGEMWDVVMGKCTTARALGTSTSSCSCSCPSGYSGYCSSSRTGTIYGWLIPPTGAQQTSSISWGSCRQTYSSCKAPPPPPPAPPPSGGGGGSVGSVFYMSGFICSSAQSGYYQGPLPLSNKNWIISIYRSFNWAGRCAELGGYLYWQNIWVSVAGGTDPAALSAKQSYMEEQMRKAAYGNGEHLPSHKASEDALCTSEAQKIYGRSARAEYVVFSGYQCRITGF